MKTLKKRRFFKQTIDGFECKKLGNISWKLQIISEKFQFSGNFKIMPLTKSNYFKQWRDWSPFLENDSKIKLGENWRKKPALESFLSLKTATLRKMNFPGAAITGTLRNFLKEMFWTTSEHNCFQKLPLKSSIA